jgi:hypothetical protein
MKHQSLWKYGTLRLAHGGQVRSGRVHCAMSDAQKNNATYGCRLAIEITNTEKYSQNKRGERNYG